MALVPTEDCAQFLRAPVRPGAIPNNIAFAGIRGSLQGASIRAAVAREALVR